MPPRTTTKQAPALAPAAQHGNGQSPDGFGSPISQLRRKNPPAVVLGVLLIAVCAFGIGAWALNVGHRTQVLVVTRPVPAGSVISASDLTTAGVAADHSVSGIPASAAGQVIGKVASDNLVPGTLLVRAEVGGGPSVPSGTSVVGLDLKPGLFPAALQPGDSVAVVSTPAQASSSSWGDGYRQQRDGVLVGCQPGWYLDACFGGGSVWSGVCGGGRRSAGWGQLGLERRSLMGMIALASARSPGLTTLAVALAATWPEPRRAVVAELDPDGGTLASSVAANPDPGLTSLAASGRHYLSPELVVSNFQQLPNGQAVLLAPPSPDRTVADLRALSPVGLGETLASLPGFDVLADCGRIDSVSPALAVLQQASAAIFVIRPTVADVVGLRDRLETLDLRSPQLGAGIVVINHGPHSSEEVARAFRLPVIGTIAWDPRCAENWLRAGARLLLRSCCVLRRRSPPMLPVRYRPLTPGLRTSARGTTLARR